ncbi:MAG TPA: TonB family protein [Pyrinomonadaceae bacterium]|jgi:TonB family protein
MNDFDGKFMQDEGLHDLLRQWKAPETPDSLDNRVAAAYQQSISVKAASDLAFNPERDSEVVKMKFCNTCQEEFADRFSFCPVDGTPLGTAPAPIVTESARQPEPTIAVETARVAPASFSVPVTAVAAAAGAQNIGEYHLTILEDRGLLSRLADELGNVAHNYQLTWPEFKRDPFGFVKRSVQGYGQMVGRFFGKRDAVLAILIAFLAMGALVGLLMVIDRTQSGTTSRAGLMVVGTIAGMSLLALFATWLGRDSGAAVMGARPADSGNVLSGIVVALVLVFGGIGGYVFWSRLHERALAKAAADEEQMELTQMITDIPNEQPTPDEGTAGMNKGNGGGSKPKQEKAGGGGGGGREEQTPASFGKLPQADLHIPQVVAPDPHPPVIKNPSLPMPATLDADPVLFPPDTRNLQYGDPKSKSTTPSSGPGTGNGIGTGTGGGVGPGEGGGYGPGRGGNTGGGDRNEGGGGPGGGGGGTDYNRIFKSSEVSSRARVLEKPEPQYTEAARKNQITGTVVLRAVFSSSGAVTNISTIRGLPDGLTERAIAAAKQIRFMPAQKDGHAVSMWMQLEYNFNLY